MTKKEKEQDPQEAQAPKDLTLTISKAAIQSVVESQGVDEKRAKEQIRSALERLVLGDIARGGLA